MFGAMAATPWAQYDSNDSFEINILNFIIFTDHENMGIGTKFGAMAATP